MGKVFLAIKHFPDYKNKACVEAISALLEKEGFQTVCLVRDFEQWGTNHLTPKQLIETAFEQIASSNLLLIETTVSGIGLGIEAGYAYAKGIPIYTIAEDHVRVSKTLLGVSQNVFKYKDTSDLAEFFHQLCLNHNP